MCGPNLNYGIYDQEKLTHVNYWKKVEIINRLEKGESGSFLAETYEVCKAIISDIQKNKETISKFNSKLESEEGWQKRKTMKRTKDEKHTTHVSMVY